MRNRSVQWCQNKIIEVLSKNNITTELALSAVVLRNVRSLLEQHNLYTAIDNLLSQKLIIKEKDPDGFTVFRLVVGVSTGQKEFLEKNTGVEKAANRIIIEVSGGVVQRVLADRADVLVEVLDYDHIDDNDASPDEKEKAKQLQEEMKIMVVIY